MVPSRLLVPGLILIAITLTSTVPNAYGAAVHRWISMGQIQCNRVAYGLRASASIVLTSNGKEIGSRSLYCLGNETNSGPIVASAKPDGWKMTVVIYDPSQNPDLIVCSATASGTRFPGSVTLDRTCQFGSATGTVQKPSMA